MLPLYNEMIKAAPVRVARYRNKVLDLKFTDKYLPGKWMPCTYASRHTVLMEDLMEEKERLMVDLGEDVQVMRVIMADLPPAMTMDIVKEATEHNQTYRS